MPSPTFKVQLDTRCQRDYLQCYKISNHEILTSSGHSSILLLENSEGCECCQVLDTQQENRLKNLFDYAATIEGRKIAWITVQNVLRRLDQDDHRYQNIDGAFFSLPYLTPFLCSIDSTSAIIAVFTDPVKDCPVLSIRGDDWWFLASGWKELPNE